MTRKAINMATGGIMSLPPYLNTKEEKDTGITPYDVDSPESARKGMPSRLLSKQRTRFSKGDEAVKPLKPLLLPGELDIPSSEDWEEMTDDKDVAWLNNKDKKELIILNIKKANSDTYGKLSEKDKKRIKELEKKDKEQAPPKKKAALGGYMDEFQIAEEEPLSR